MAAASAKGLASPEVQSNMASGNFSFVGRMIMRRLFYCRLSANNALTGLLLQGRLSSSSSFSVLLLSL